MGTASVVKKTNNEALCVSECKSQTIGQEEIIVCLEDLPWYGIIR